MKSILSSIILTLAFFTATDSYGQAPVTLPENVHDTHMQSHMQNHNHAMETHKQAHQDALEAHDKAHNDAMEQHRQATARALENQTEEPEKKEGNFFSRLFKRKAEPAAEEQNSEQ